MRSMVLSAALILTGSASFAATLDFLGNDACVSGANCAVAQAVSQDYGDVSGAVDVTYDGDTALDGLQNMYLFGWGYGDPSVVAYSWDPAEAASITFEATAGNGVSIDGLKISAFNDYWSRSSRETFLTISDLFGTVLYNSGALTLAAGEMWTFTDTVTSAGGLVLEFGTAGGWVGITNIAYNFGPAEQQTTRLAGPPSQTPAPVPLPASALLLLAGLGGLTVFRKRSA
ncbi:MAG: VPLPA-CTERM sorting domain-containing protein [Pseudomonadota bacterium]